MSALLALEELLARVQTQLDLERHTSTREHRPVFAARARALLTLAQEKLAQAHPSGTSIPITLVRAQRDLLHVEDHVRALEARVALQAPSIVMASATPAPKTTPPAPSLPLPRSPPAPVPTRKRPAPLAAPERAPAQTTFTNLRRARTDGRRSPP